MTTKLFSLQISLRTITAIALAVLLTSGVSAKELRLASGVPPLHPAHDPLYTEFQTLLPELSSGNLSGQLLGTEVTTLGNMRASIMSGLVEVGLFLPTYFPADLPNFNLIGDLSLLGENPQVTAAAITEYIATCKSCQAEFNKLGMVYTTTHANPYNLLTKKPVRGSKDLEGLRIRVATPQHARWAGAMSAKPVNLTTGEAFEALSQGVVDGTIASISDLIAFNLSEVISNITLLDMGTFHSISNHTIKQTVWQAMSSADREAVLKASFLASIRTTKHWLDMVAKGKQVAKDKGIQILEPSEELVEKTNAFKEKDLVSAAAAVEERYGVEGAEDKIARFQALTEKWEQLIADTDGSEEALAELYHSEILSQIDLSSYGQ